MRPRRPRRHGARVDERALERHVERRREHVHFFVPALPASSGGRFVRMTFLAVFFLKSWRRLLLLLLKRLRSRVRRRRRRLELSCALERSIS